MIFDLCIMHILAAFVIPSKTPSCMICSICADLADLHLQDSKYDKLLRLLYNDIEKYETEVLHMHPIAN